MSKNSIDILPGASTFPAALRSSFISSATGLGEHLPVDHRQKVMVAQMGLPAVL
ncbi:hypothetical protein [Cystobacter fuscus]|uniref:hypothetical protein n=1 Tax=Cystobacter fuscus TaxID=43 RepID=UPI0018DF386A|nr:hypothetical protein [Cystobacter fuscus]